MKSKPIFCTDKAKVLVNDEPARFDRDGNYVTVEIDSVEDEIRCIEPNGFTVHVQNGNMSIGGGGVECDNCGQGKESL